MHHFGHVPRIELLILGFVLVALFRPGPWFSGESRRRRERAHAERMRALELGLPVPANDSPWPRAWVCIAIGAFVPIGALFCAWMICLTAVRDSEVQGFVWLFAFIVAVTAVVSGSRLATTLFASHGQPTLAPPRDGKPPAYDPESFDRSAHVS
jgi:hypothetical protein